MDAERVEKIRERLLLCPICLDEYKDPRILPCHHSVCVDCLQSLITVAHLPTRLFRCPECRADTLVPSGGVRAFPPNFFMSSLLEEIGSKPYLNACDLCQRTGIHAQFRCVTCDLDVCKFCIAQHRLVEHENENLPLLRLETRNVSVESFTADHLCVNHSEPVHLFCETCNRSVCLTCVCNDHKLHTTVSMKHKRENAQTRKLNICAALQNEAKYITDFTTKINEFNDSCTRDYYKTRQQVLTQRDDLYAAIDQFTDDKLTKVDTEIEHVEKSISVVKQESELYRTSVVNLLSFLTDFQKDDLNIEFSSEIEQKVADLKRVRGEFKTSIEYNRLHMYTSNYISKWGLYGYSLGFLKKSASVWSHDHSQNNEKQSKSFFQRNHQSVSVLQRTKTWVRCARKKLPHSKTIFRMFHIVTLISIFILMSLAMYQVALSDNEIKTENETDTENHDEDREKNVPGASCALVFLIYLFVIFIATLYNHGI